MAPKRRPPDSPLDPRIERYLTHYVAGDSAERSRFYARRGRIPLFLLGFSGFVVGVAIWGALSLSVLSGVRDLVLDDDASISGARPPEVVLRCEFLANAERTEDDEIFFQNECSAEDEDTGRPSVSLQP